MKAGVLAGRILVVIGDAVALMLLSAILPGFSTDNFGSALGAAVVIGVFNALAWPLVLRFALPITVLTLGLPVLLVNGAVVVAAAALDEGVHVEDLLSGVVVALGLTLITTLLAELFALDDDRAWQRRVVRRQLGRTKLAVESDVPGVLFLEIDGLAYDVLRRALRDGNAPTLAGWVHGGSHRLERWRTAWSSQTGACQAGLLHGSDEDWPAFRWWEKDRGQAIVTNHPKDAAELERRHSDGRGLLHADGASRANILSGDAPHSMLTMSTVLDRERKGRLGQDYFAYFASPFGVARTFLRSLGEIVVERWAALEQRRRDVLPRIHRGWEYAVVRAWATIVQLDLQVAAVTADVLAGRPVVYTTFLAYDEVAHHSGLERHDTLKVLRRVDRAIARIARAVEHAPRPYRLIVLSDHGQSQGATFLQRYGETLEELVVRTSGAGEVQAAGGDTAEGASSLAAGITELAASQTPMGRAVRVAASGRMVDGEVVLDAGERTRRERLEAADEVPELSVMASGNLGLISFPREPGRVTLEDLDARRPGLVDALRHHPGIGFVLVRSAVHGSLVLGPAGTRYLDADRVEGDDPLAPYGEQAVAVVRRTDRFAHCPDLVVNSTWWDSTEEVAAFEELVGSHGGLGGGQSEPFVLFPADLPWSGEPIVGPATMHGVLRGWLAHLGHDAYAIEARAVSS